THNDGYISGQFSFANNLIIGSATDGGTGTITALGTGAQTYSVHSSAPRTCVLAINKTSGALTPNPGTNILLVQGINQIAGNFTAPAGTLSVGGSWNNSTVIYNHTDGAFTHNNGLVIFEPYSNCFWGTYGLNIIPSTLFYDVMMNGGGSCGVYATFTIAANDTLEASNTLTFNNGRVNSNHVACQSTVYIVSGYDGGNSNLILTGNNSGIIDATGAAAVYDGRITIAKTNASKIVTLNSALVMDGAGQSLVFSKGRIISTAGNLLELGDNVTVSGASDSSYVSGLVRKSGNDAFAFPVGKTSVGGTYNYAPIIISAPSTTTAQFTAEYFLTNPDPLYSIASKTSSIHHISSTEYWILDRTTSTANVSVSLTWAARSGGVVSPASDITVAKWDGSQWIDQGNGGILGSAASGTVISSGVVTAFSPFSLGSRIGLSPLPVELTSFTAQCTDSEILVKWVTQSELNNNFFTMQSSIDGSIWTNIAKISGNKTSNQTKNYEYSVSKNEFESNPVYLRLKQTDFNSTETVFPSIYLAPCKENNNYTFQIYPTPSSDYCYVESNSYINNFTVYNSLGQVQKTEIQSLSPNKIKLNMQALVTGVYYLQLYSDGRIHSIKIVKS
ncbi:MAG: T9SS type A sorting domain-containing protein, partial [Bacteroidia bacterium]|nr:T9SS type A sorting domain-containing protein [Bacteroidia bacterium]